MRSGSAARHLRKGGGRHRRTVRVRDAAGIRRFGPMALAMVGTLAALGGAPVEALGAPAGATVDSPDTPLNIRSGGSSAHKKIGTVADGAAITVSCQVFGQQIAGSVRSSPYWLRLTGGGYVTEAYVRWRPERPHVAWCGPTAATVPVARPGGTSGLNVRSVSNTGGRELRKIKNGETLHVVCQDWGESVAGTQRRSAAWNRLAEGGYVADANVAWPSSPTLPWCGQAPPTVPAGTPEAFIARVAEPAREGMRQYKVPASVTIAQAILESGWGGSGLTRRDHNYFGIKCFGTPGGIAVGCRTYETSECNSKGCYRTRASFRAYRNASGSMVDHGRFLTVNPRYAPAFQWDYAPERFARAIHKAGYATSPTYADNLINIMRRYDLTRFDLR
ncbi:sporangiospore maturation cell wall hydrolase GsmA [Catenuloplanes atrovinosus]|uniref:Flagellar protein FlgJ n=1 Tax=Catenuloplanes atrovinosus TaxID=137266 RepID=A0AAE3YT01_9ACTN|nr:sporangiospore maturation cell wall hydrolase GsmA [Catenuloplanes atrovinosus]MDR7278057.1 flagellar protein FlgJ [Catenuloplanes atrovinosus]